MLSALLRDWQIMTVSSPANSIHASHLLIGHDCLVLELAAGNRQTRKTLAVSQQCGNLRRIALQVTPQCNSSVSLNTFLPPIAALQLKHWYTCKAGPTMHVLQGWAAPVQRLTSIR